MENKPNTSPNVKSLEAKLLAVLRDASSPLTVVALKKRAKGRNTFLGIAIKNLLSEGRIVRSGKGINKSPYLYSLVIDPMAEKPSSEQSFDHDQGADSPSSGNVVPILK